MDRIRQMLEVELGKVETRIGELRHQLGPLEQEVATIRRAIAALDGGPLPLLPNGHDPPSPYEGLTMKDLTLRALREHFPLGATASQLLEFFDKAYNRKIERSSLSPQLSRLKADGFLDYEDNLWKLSSIERLGRSLNGLVASMARISDDQK